MNASMSEKVVGVAGCRGGDGDLLASQVVFLRVFNGHGHGQADVFEGFLEFVAGVQQVDHGGEDHVSRGPAIGLKQQFLRHGPVILHLPGPVKPLQDSGGSGVPLDLLIFQLQLKSTSLV